MVKWLGVVVVLFGLMILTATDEPSPEYRKLPGYEEKVSLPNGDVFSYAFAQAPKMGWTVLRLRVKDAAGNPVQSYRVTGRSDMPSMAGAHDSGQVVFKLNKKGDYLLPVNIVMPGEWEVKLIFWQDEKIVFAGSFHFDV